MTRFALAHKPVVLIAALIAMVYGASTFLTMSRRENPRMTIRSCVIETRWEGASAEKIEDLVTRQLEDVVYQIEEVETLESMSRTGFSKIDVELIESVGPGEIDQIWDKVRDKVELVQGQLPPGCAPPFVNSDFGDVSSVCLVLHQADSMDGMERYSYRQLERIADDLEKKLKALPQVASITTFGVPEETITLGVRAGEWSKLRLLAGDLATALEERNVVNGGVLLSAADRAYPLRPSGELSSLEELREVTVTTLEGDRPVTVGDLPLLLERGPETPLKSSIRFTAPGGRAPRAVLLGIAMKQGQNVVELGQDVDRTVAEFQARELPPDLKVTRVNDLPRQVHSLVADFMESLWQAIVIVLGVAWLMMGWRPALVMAMAIPLSMVTTIAVVPHFDVELEQFAIASLIIVLGMVVDNAIVVTDNVQRLLNEGQAHEQAAVEGAEGLARSILSSTLTTVGAFLPMLTIPGETGEYMRSLPIVVSATLLSSYVVAMSVTPIMSAWLLRPAAEASQGRGRLAGLYVGLVERAVTRRLLTLGLAAAAIAGALGLTPLIGSQFFPGGIRDQFFIDVTLPTGSTVEATSSIVERIETLLLETSPAEVEGEQTERLVHATAFVGTGGPRLFLSLDPSDGVPHEATILVNTASAELSRPWVDELRGELTALSGARIEVRPYELGPPIDTPVGFRLQGEDLTVLRTTADRLMSALEQVPGTTGVHSDWAELGHAFHLKVDSQRASLAGVTSEAIADSLSELFGGVRLTTLHEGEHRIPIELRLNPEERGNPRVLEEIMIGAGEAAVPLNSVARTEVGWEHAAIARRNRVRTVSLGARVLPGFLANEVSTVALPELQAIAGELPRGYSLELAGEAEETATSQVSVGAALKISIVAIFLVLLVQYNSVIKPFVVLAAFPLSLIGAMLGLFVTGWPLGFMPMLGIVALAGTVINNAIVLIEFIESEVATGTLLVEAVSRAGLARMQPILLTTLTTIGGLLPLALFGGPMWAGMSWAMIFGLALSTVLTLVVIPTIYVLFVERFRMKVSA